MFVGCVWKWITSSSHVGHFQFSLFIHEIKEINILSLMHNFVEFFQKKFQNNRIFKLISQMAKIVAI